MKSTVGGATAAFDFEHAHHSEPARHFETAGQRSSFPCPRKSLSMLDRLKATMLLAECTGRDIWSVDHCRRRGIPEPWIEELAECYESGYRTDLQTIYVGERTTNQYHGVLDRNLAYKLGEYLGVDTERVTALALGGPAEVRAIREAVEEG
jgi:hypothetical protein